MLLPNHLIVCVGMRSTLSTLCFPTALSRPNRAEGIMVLLQIRETRLILRVHSACLEDWKGARHHTRCYNNRSRKRHWGRNLQALAQALRLLWKDTVLFPVVGLHSALVQAKGDGRDPAEEVSPL